MDFALATESPEKVNPNPSTLLRTGLEILNPKWFDKLTIRFDKLTTSPSKVEGQIQMTKA
jgi:hypothetical protein